MTKDDKRFKEGEYRSKEELFFSWWLNDLESGGYIDFWGYEFETYELLEPVKYAWTKQLKTKVKWNEGSLLKGLSYTPDFVIWWSKEGSSMFTWDKLDHERRDGTKLFITRGDSSSRGMTLIDVKGSYDRNKSNSTFSIIQKVMYARTGILVEKVVPEKLFKATFTPGRYLMTDSGRQARKIKWEPRTLEEYVWEK